MGACCGDCHGTGRLGVEGAEPEIEIGKFWCGGDHRYKWRPCRLAPFWMAGSYGNVEAALAAARKRNFINDPEIRVKIDTEYGGYRFLRVGTDEYWSRSTFPTEAAALAAARKAQR